MSYYGLDNSFIEIYDQTVMAFLQQQGSALMMATTPVNIVGNSEAVRQFGVGEAQWVTDSGGITQFGDKKWDKRILIPKEFEYAISLEDSELIRQGLPPIDDLAISMANACGRMIDDIIISGIGGKARSESLGEVALPGAREAGVTVADNTPGACVTKYDKTQTIAWNDYTRGGNLSNDTITVKAGLNASKIAKAVMKLRAKYNQGYTLVCVADEYMMSTLRADHRVANTLFNTQPSMATGAVTPYGGCNAFIPSERVDGGTSAVGANGHGTNNVAGLKVKYAYVYAVEMIKLGCSMPLRLTTGQNSERRFAQVLRYAGMYDCCRMFEESVVRIECVEDFSQGNITDASFAL